MKLLPILAAVLFAAPANAFDKQTYREGMIAGGTISTCRLYNNGDITVGEMTDEFQRILIFAENNGLGGYMEEVVAANC